MTRIGLVGAGAMGSALGAGWLAGGADVVTCLAGRSARSVELARAAGLRVVDSLDEVVRSDVVVSVVPPTQALDVAGGLADAAGRTGARPLVVDLNAVAPTTVAAIGSRLARAGLDLVDGSISGGPPSAGRAVRVYVCGPGAATFLAVPNGRIDAVTLPGAAGQASALKMCTASMYKGSKALVMQAMLTARHHGVLEAFLADVARAWPDDVPGWPADIALAATKADRFVGEMHEIARTQAGAGLPPGLFEGAAAAYARAARTPLGRRAPEQVDPAADAGQVLADLDASRSAVLFDFSGTLFHIESAQQSLLGALGVDYLHLAPAMERFGGINGSTTPEILPADMEQRWAARDLSAQAHHDAYTGLSMHAGLDRDEADTLYRRGISAEAWSPFPDTVRLLRTLHARGVPVAVVSNIGWDLRPVLARYGVDADIDALVLSYELGVEKPDPAIFRHACDALGVAPGDAVMIGDNPTADGGSTALGIPFVQVAAHPHERRPDELTEAVAAALDRNT